MAREPLKFGVPIPQVFLDTGEADMALVRAAVRRAEELGFHSVWVQDQVHGFVPLLESITLLSYAAALSQRLELGVSVIVFPVRNPVMLAKQVTSLDQLSGGRMNLGLGLGPPLGTGGFYEAFGVKPEERLKRFNDGLAIMKSLWTQEETHLESAYWPQTGTMMQPKPVRRPYPTLWIGGQHPNALRRAVREGDGYTSAGPTTIREYKEHVALVRQYLEEEDRDPDRFPISRRIYLALDDDADQAKAGLQDWFQRRYPWLIAQNANLVDEICVWGTSEQVTEGLQDVINGGARTIILNPLWDYLEQMDTLAQEVVPHLV